MNTKINHVAVWTLIVVYFLICCGWYAVFGETSLNLHARTMTDIERTHNVDRYVLPFLGSIAVNYTLAASLDDKLSAEFWAAAADHAGAARVASGRVAC